MSFNLNSVMLAGNLTKKPEFKAIGEKSIALFSLAVNKKYKAKDGTPKERVLFIECEAWGKTGELVAQYLDKGSPVYVQGELVMDQWDDKATGAKRSKIKVVVEQVQFLPKAGRSEDGPDTPSPSVPAPAQPDDSSPPF